MSDMANLLPHEFRIWQRLMRAIKADAVPPGYYGPETCRWATRDEIKRFGLKSCPLVHLDDNGNIDCYFTETAAVVVGNKH